MILNNNLICPKKGLFDLDKNQPVFTAYHLRRKNKVFNEEPSFEPYLKTMESAYYAGFKFNHFGHFLLESLSRLHEIKSSNYKTIVWISNVNDKNFRTWQLEIFKLLEIDAYNHIVVTEPTLIKNIELHQQEYIVPDIFSEKQNNFLSVYNPPKIIKNKKIWLSRQGVKGGWSNELIIEQKLEKNGWIIYHPEKYNIIEQLNEILSSEIIAGIEGSAFHTLILAKEVKSKILLFSRRATDKLNGSKVNENYITIAKVKKFDQTEYYPNQKYIEGTRINSVFEVDVDEVIKHIEQYDHKKLLKNAPLLFIHIPKTAGTSFRKAAETYFGSDQVLYDYGHNNSETSEVVNRIIYKRKDFFALAQSMKKMNFLSGHMQINKYAPLFNPLNVITLIRNPVNQVISHYEHYKRDNNYQDNFETFYKTPRFCNLQSRVLSNYPIQAIGTIGLTEKYFEFLNLINSIHNTDIKYIKTNINIQKKTDEYIIDDTTKKTIELYNQKDINLYQQAHRQFEQMFLAYIQGYNYTYHTINVNDYNMLTGWCFQRNKNQPIILEIINLDNENIIQQILCNEYNPTMKLINAPRNGYIGFRIDCTHAKFNNKKLLLRVKGSGQILAELDTTQEKPKIILN